MPFTTKFGTAPGVAAMDVPAVIWTGHDGAGDPFPTSPGQISIASDSIEDAAGQTGVSMLRVSALTLVEVLAAEPGREDKMVYVFARFFATLNGTSDATIIPPDPLVCDPSMGWRITGALAVGTPGSAGSNVGTISLSIGGVVANEIRPGNGNAESAIVSIGGSDDATASRWFSSLLDVQGQSTAQGIVRAYGRPFGGPKVEAAPPISLTEAAPRDEHVLKHDLNLGNNIDYWSEVTFVDSGPADFSAGLDFEIRPRLRQDYAATP